MPDIVGMGLWAVDLLSNEQLAAAANRYFALQQEKKEFMVATTLLRQTWTNHWQRVMRMPAGGAQGGGSMQTGFEMEMVTVEMARVLMKGWPNQQDMRCGGLSWEARTMEVSVPAQKRPR